MRRLSVTDGDVLRMRDAWPELVRLHVAYGYRPLYHNDPGPPASHPSLGAVVALAARAPRLESLSIDVADVAETELAALEARAEQQRALVHFLPAVAEERLEGIVLCDVPRLASALRAIFPSLTGRMQLTNDRGRLVGSRLSKLSVRGDVERAGPVCNLLQALDGLKSHSL